MGEEEKKPLVQESKKQPEDDKKGDKKKSEAASPPQEIVLKVYLHCEGCARKVRRCLEGFDGVEKVATDCRSNQVVVKGQKADPVKVLERVQRKSHRQVELLSPIPKPPPPKDDRMPEPTEQQPNPPDKKEELKAVTVVLKVHMHCNACAQEMKKLILRMKGVESAEPDLKGSVVAVRGVLEPAKLVDYVYKRTGKQAVIVKQEPVEEEKKKEEEAGKDKEEKKGDEGGGGGNKKGDDGGKDKKGGGGGGGGEEEEMMVNLGLLEMKKNENMCYLPRLVPMEYYGNGQVYRQHPYQYQYQYQPAPQMFSDENPNACSLM